LEAALAERLGDVTTEDFSVDKPKLRTLTLLGGNCRLEVLEASASLN